MCWQEKSGKPQRPNHALLASGPNLSVPDNPYESNVYFHLAIHHELVTLLFSFMALRRYVFSSKNRRRCKHNLPRMAKTSRLLVTGCCFNS